MAKRVEETEGYSNDKHTLRREFGIDSEVDGSEAAGGLGDTGRGHGQRGPQWDQGANLGVLDDVALLWEPADALSPVEETDLHQENVGAWCTVVLKAPGPPRGVVVPVVHLVQSDPF